MNEKWTDSRNSTKHEKPQPMTNSMLARLVGGSPLGVFVRLVLLSIVVGFIMVHTGLDPWKMFQHLLNVLKDLVEYIREHGLEPLQEIWQYFLLGAAVVIPIWLLIRLMSGLGRK